MIYTIFVSIVSPTALLDATIGTLQKPAILANDLVVAISGEMAKAFGSVDDGQIGLSRVNHAEGRGHVDGPQINLRRRLPDKSVSQCRSCQITSRAFLP